MIITVGGTKGGSGKSLIATNLVVLRANLGHNILLVDGDEQSTSSDWVRLRNQLGVDTSWTTIPLYGTAIRTEVKKLSPNYDDVIIDVGGTDTDSLRSAMIISDKLLVPFAPRNFDIWTIEKLAAIVQEAQSINSRLGAYGFINFGKAMGQDNRDAQDIIAGTRGFELLPVVVGFRSAFVDATGKGKAVVETRLDRKAIKEIQELHDALFDT